MTQALHIEEAASVWLARRDGERWSSTDEAALAAWLDQDAGHRVAFLRLESVWIRADRMAALRAPSSRGVGRPRSARRRWMMLPVALGAAAAGVIVVVLMTLKPAVRDTYTTGVGERRVVAMADGSTVELNTRTNLSVGSGADRRSVRLDGGEAWFEVAHDPKHPFVIQVGDRQVTVLGTKFSVRRDGDKVEVVVAEGKVRVEDPRQPERHPAVLATPQQMVLADAAGTLVAPISAERLTSELAWRRGMLMFDGVALREVAGEFNRYNKKQIAVDAKVADVRIGGSFEATNIEGFARLLRKGFDLKVEDQGMRLTVSE
jgi:transmembrane sensor